MRIRGCWDENGYSVISLLLLAATLHQSICNALLHDFSPLSLFPASIRTRKYRMLTSCFPSVSPSPTINTTPYSLSQSSFLAKWLNIKLGQFSCCLLSSLHSVLRSWLSFFLRLLLCLPGLLSNRYKRTHARTHTSHAGPSTNQPFARDHQDGTRVPRQLWCFVAAAVTIYPGAVTRALFPCCNNKISCVDVNAGWQLSGGVLATKWTAVSVYWSEICEWGESV